MQDNFSKTILRLREARQQLDLSLEQVAQRTGYAVSTIGNLETGKSKPSRRLILRISEALGINPEWLETGVEPMFSIGQTGEARDVLRQKLEDNIAAIQNLSFEVTEMGRKFGISVDWERSPKRQLTNTSELGRIDPVKSDMTSLLERVRKLTEPPPRGKMASLAEYLEVPQSRVSEWLAGKCKPDGENTLKLLHWVEQQERK